MIWVAFAALALCMVFLAIDQGRLRMQVESLSRNTMGTLTVHDASGLVEDMQVRVSSGAPDIAPEDMSGVTDMHRGHSGQAYECVVGKPCACGQYRVQNDSRPVFTRSGAHHTWGCPKVEG